MGIKSTRVYHTLSRVYLSTSPSSSTGRPKGVRSAFSRSIAVLLSTSDVDLWSPPQPKMDMYDLQP